MSTSTLIYAAGNNCQLSYAISSVPDPLQVSPAQGNASYAAFTIVVSNNTFAPLYCNKIVFSFPVGILAQDLTNTPGNANTAATPSTWNIVNNGDGTFTCTPKQPQNNEFTTNGISFQVFNIPVNQQVGTFTFTVDETSSTNNQQFSQYENNYSLAKFPYGFFFSNFTASAPMVQDGQTVTLSWTGSENATYTMLFGSQSVDVTTVTSWTSPALNNTTTFILKATAESASGSVNAFLSVTVIVANPEITATLLTVLQTSTLNGNTTVGTAAAPATLAVNGNISATGNESVNGSLVVSQNATVNGTLGVGQNATVGGTLTVTGAESNASLTTGQLTVNGAAGVQVLNASGSITAGGNLSANYLSSNGVNSNGTIISPLSGPYNAGVFTNSGSQYTLGTTNSTSDTGHVTGIYAQVVTSSDWGVASNGQIGGSSGSALITHLPTRKGHRVVTSPLSLHAEVQASGKGKLVKGKAKIKFDAEVADIIFHSDKEAFTVQLTPTGQCGGLAVTSKKQDHFIVQELNGGKSSAGFDWFIIARKRASKGAKAAHQLPEKLPAPAASSISSGTQKEGKKKSKK